MRYRIACLCFFLIILFEYAYSQQDLSIVTLEQYFVKCQEQTGLRFFYKSDWIKDVKVPRQKTSAEWQDVLQSALPELNLTYHLYKNKYVILLQHSPSDAPVQTRDSLQTDDSILNGNKSYVVSGYVIDVNGEVGLEEALIYVDGGSEGILTQKNGYFSITMRVGIHTLLVTYQGKLPTEKRIVVKGNTRLNFELVSELTELEEVVITAGSGVKNVLSVGAGITKMEVNTVKKLPAFMGEVDVLKSIDLLPGVSTVGEGANGFNVRGGNADQNLILMDGVPVFNSSHLFGFFSVFNPDIVNDMTLYKGYMPAEYGGRLSSVVDIGLKEGSFKKFSGKGGIGLIASRLSLEGPIVKDKSSVIVSARYGYPNLAINSIQNINVNNSGGQFFDINLKTKFKLGERSDIVFSGYYSYDDSRLASDTVNGWNMYLASLEWRTMVGKDLFISVTGYGSLYKYSVEGLTSPSLFTTNFGVDNYGLKADASKPLGSKIELKGGFAINAYQINPGALKGAENSSINDKSLQLENSREYSLYTEMQYDITPKMSVLAGIRASVYHNLGSSNVFMYEPLVSKSALTIVDTVSYGAGEVINRYSGLEPRVSLRFAMDDFSSIKLSYNRTIQYIHLISNTAGISPLDIWKSSGPYVKPQTANQIALGYFRNLSANSIEASVEVYGKRIDNLVEYKDGAELFLNEHIETELVSAKGVNYGVEVMIRKNIGKTTGWLAYTYSRAWRQTQSKYPEDNVNNGDYYPSNYDRPNDLSLVVNHKITKRLNVSANFSYSTGRPITYPESIYIIDGYAVSHYSERNKWRIPDYHRLDISINLDESLKRKKSWYGSWSLSVLNVYARKNAYSIFFKPDNSGRIAQAYRLSILGTVLPTLTYNFRF